MTTTETAPRFGDLLRRWRSARRVSQLDLAASAEVSQRHVSFLETGRALPSREMVLHLGAVLDLPLRDRNAMLVAAGYAPAYQERRLDEPALDQMHHVLSVILAAHEPFPAYVVDRGWNVLLSNEAAGRLVALLIDPGEAARFAGNLLRLSMHPRGLRPSLLNWEEAATALLDRVEREALERPMDTDLLELLDEVRAYPGVAELAKGPLVPNGPALLVPLHIRSGNVELRLFTTIATIGAPYDVTLEELRIETLLPADADSEAALQRLAGQHR